ncbi:GNAT family N-acetyltransferase [Nocardiopsis ansamitocini]|nr:GNAT family protein [Nocardiopsis ansamitocini]
MTARHWPLFALTLRTERLELRLPTLAELDELAQVAAEGVHDPEQMPFQVPWTDALPQQRARSVMQYHWLKLAEWTPAAWSLQLAVFEAGRVVGVQEVGARDFAVTREVKTGSWLGRAHQGRGIGTEMRAAVLELAFAGLGAQVARTSVFSDNERSMAVSRRLGYRGDGGFRIGVQGRMVNGHRLVLERSDWEHHRRGRTCIDALDACKERFGLR